MIGSTVDECILILVLVADRAEQGEGGFRDDVSLGTKAKGLEICTMALITIKLIRSQC